jgi:glycine dehydrogenase subunit 2
MLNSQGRVTAVGAGTGAAPETISGDRGLDHEEPLLFEVGRAEVTGVDLPDIAL